MGKYTLGSQAKPIVIKQAIYNRNFLEPHLPLLRAGDIISISGSDSAGQNIMVVFEGYKVQSYG
jgi:hypothetical protein